MTPNQPRGDGDRYHLFDVVGIELEYTLVDRSTLDVRPEADRLLELLAGRPASEVALREITLSNELVLHVVELKVSDPVPSLVGLAPRFHRAVRRLNHALAPSAVRLMPTGAHPWMDPERDAKLWPHEGREIYQQFDRIFSCRSHGWTNLQSMHINLPFADDEEFGRLHAAIRLLLPILPAMAASTPLLDGRVTGWMDSRLEVYRTNAQRVPSVAGFVIPEPIFHVDEYQTTILEGVYRDLAPFDAGGILRYEWVNARGAIPRFERNTIEIRVLDLQECPSADLALAALTVAVLRPLVAERWSSWSDQKSWAVEPLRRILLNTIRHADRAVIDDPAYLAVFGYPGAAGCTAGELWDHLVQQVGDGLHEHHPLVEAIRREGPVARRILHAVGPAPDRDALRGVVQQLCDCLAEDCLFHR